MQVRLIGKTSGTIGTEYEGKSIDEIIVGIARISSSRETNELFDEPHKLLRHCLLNAHYSIFEMANMSFEIVTSRAITQQLKRHSFSIQEFSQRYSTVTELEPIELRKQAKSNRQSSEEIIEDEGEYYSHYTNRSIDRATEWYSELIDNGVARECARFVLPECTQTKLIINSRIREIITFLNARLHHTAQKEIRLVAQAIRDIFLTECPIISECLYNFSYAENIHILDRLILEKYNLFEQIKNNNFRALKYDNK